MTALCQLAGDWRGTIPQGGTMAEPKIDGWRALYFAGIDGVKRLWTRNGLPIEGTGHIMHRLAQMEAKAGEPMVFDGEFQVNGNLADTKTWCERGWKFGGEAGVFHVFDCLTFAEWQAGGSDTPSYQRKARLAALWEAVEADPALSWEWRPGSRGRDEGAIPVVLMPDQWAFDAGDVIDMARRIWAEGGEGVMLKDPESPYRRNRNSAWLKVKAENMHKWRMAA